MKNLLTVENLEVSLKKDDEWIQPINDVNFTVGYQETVGLVGESGSGKSLSARAILKLFSKQEIRIQAKQILLGNIDLQSAGRKLMQKVLGIQVGIIMQDTQSCLDPTMKIREQIIESMLFHKIFSDKEKAICEAKKLLDLVEIPNSAHVLNCYPFELSGGMKQRVVIATTIATKPKLLIADEPTSALDMESEEATLDLLRLIQKEFLTSILLITHDLKLAKNFCEKIVVMYQGRTIETLSKQHYHQPYHPYTQHLLHSKPTFKTPKDLPLLTLENERPKLKTQTACAFVHKCPKAMKICSYSAPFSSKIHPEHEVSCFLASVPKLEESFV